MVQVPMPVFKRSGRETTCSAVFPKEGQGRLCTVHPPLPQKCVGFADNPRYEDEEGSGKC